jgi:hypothetical protein
MGKSQNHGNPGRSRYDQRKKSSCPFKRTFNAWVSKHSRGFRNAIVLDTSYFATSRALLDNHDINKIVAPQNDKEIYRKMKRNLRDHRHNNTEWSRVDVLNGTMADVIKRHGHAAMRENLLVWHDATATWDNPKEVGTSVHADIKEIIRTFGASKSKRLLCAVTISTRDSVHTHSMQLGDIRTVITRDIDVEVARFPGLVKTIRAEKPYPQMLFFAFELTRTVPLKLAVGDRVRIWWDACAHWGAGWYDGDIKKICRGRFTVLYPGDMWEEHSEDKLIRPAE